MQKYINEFYFTQQRKRESIFKLMLKGAKPVIQATDTWEEVCYEIA